MKMFFLITTTLITSLLAFSQKVSLRTYDNHVNIDNYWGEVDSILLKENIRTVKTYMQKDSLTLIQTDEYIKGRRVYSEERSGKYGDVERRIFYDYEKNKMEASIIHYPCKAGYGVMPANRFYYLWSSKGNVSTAKYSRDSSQIVFMLVRHEWLPNGDIYFSSFNRRGKLIDSLTMHKVEPLPSAYDKLKFPAKGIIYSDTLQTIIDKEIHYDANGRLIYLKSCGGVSPCLEEKYFYDLKGFLSKYERSFEGTSSTKLIYEYY